MSRGIASANSVQEATEVCLLEGSGQRPRRRRRGESRSPWGSGLLCGCYLWGKRLGQGSKAVRQRPRRGRQTTGHSLLPCGNPGDDTGCQQSPRIEGRSVTSQGPMRRKPPWVPGHTAHRKNLRGGEGPDTERELPELSEGYIWVQVQATVRSHLPPTGMATRKKVRAENVGEDMGKLEAWVLLMGTQNAPAARENSMARPPKRHPKITVRSSSSSSGQKPRRTGSRI